MAGDLVVVAVVEEWGAEAEWPGLEEVVAAAWLVLREVWGIHLRLVAAIWVADQEECQRSAPIRARVPGVLTQEM